jgi:hypothetical protein
VLLLATTINAIDAVNGMGSPEITPGWRDPTTGDTQYFRDYLEAFSWMQHHTPQGSIVVSWWDYGYWTRQVGDRFTVVDNATNNKTQIAWVGRMLMETDPVEALRICQMYGIDYVFAHFGLGNPGLSGDEGKWQWMIRIAGEVFGDEVPDETDFWDPQRQMYLEPFFDTLLYNMLYLNASQVGVDPPLLNGTENPGPAPSLTTDPGRTIFSIFVPTYFSETQLMKIYEPDYTYIESGMELTGASAFPVNQGSSEAEDLSQIIVKVHNTGIHPITIGNATIEYWDARQERNRVYQPPDFFLATDTNNKTILPDETVLLNIRSVRYFTLGTDINVTIDVAGFTPTLEATITVPVRQAPAYDLTGLVANSWAYDNGTIYIEVQNTGEGYLEVDEEGLLNDVPFSIENAILTRGRILFTTEVLGITIDASYWNVDLVAGEEVTVLMRYMSNQPLYSGLNVTIPITIQAAPSPPSPPSSAQVSSQVNNPPPKSVIKIFEESYAEPVSFSVFCFIMSSFFIFRRYSP